MAANCFETCLTAILREEGGYAELPGDPGGATNMGVTRATLAAHRGVEVSRADVRALTREEAAGIYRAHYWAAIGGDDLAPGLDLALFDDAVNSGPHQAIRDLQRALGVAVDGRIGPVTRAALARRPAAEIVAALCQTRRDRLAGLKTFPMFGRGWLNRIGRIERQSLAACARPNPEAARTAAAREKEKDMPQIKDTKPFWASQTIWSSLAVVGSSLAGAMIAWKANDMAGFGASLTALFGGVNAIVGRVRGTTPIG